jgi:VWFA-related protein
MTRLVAALVVVSAVALGHAQSQPPAGARESAALVQIDVVALDANGIPVTDLRQDEVEVWIGGYRVPISTFTPVTAASDGGGRMIVLLLDNVTVDLPSSPRVREVARRFVNRMLPGDRMAVIGLDGDTMESTDDRGALLRAIEAYRTPSLGVVRLDSAGQQVLRTIASLSRQVAESPGRKTIVGIGTGWLFDTPIPPPQVGANLRPEWTEAMRSLAFANANVYVIDPRGLGSTRVTSGSAGFAREAGGHTYMNTNDFNTAVDRIMREAGSYYLLGVGDPPIQRKADLRPLDVRVHRRGVTVRARRWVPGTGG